MSHLSGYNELLTEAQTGRLEAPMSSTREFQSQAEIDLVISEAAKSVTSAPTGAGCFKSFNFASCSQGITHKQALEIAAKTGTVVTWYEGKTCSQITCKA
jgi:hypothetical protein